MDNGDAAALLLLTGCLTALVILLARRVASIEEDMDLMNIAAGSLPNLLEAKRMIEARAVARAEERGLR